MLRSVLAAVLVSVPVLAGAVTLDQAVQDPARTEKFKARDAARHPAEELAFFGVRPDATVVEIWPGGGYWTEILAPYLKAGGGTLYAAVPAGVPEEQKFAEAFRAKMAADPARFSAVKITELGPNHDTIAPDGSADFVLTFRNLHNWMEMGIAPEILDVFYRTLKHGGVLGVEDHRASTATPQDPKADNGYVRQDYAIELIEKAGFRFAGSSEIDANPRDTKDYKEGVWTLPPTFALKDQDRAKYAAIGEADNFVLKFVKP